jgi:putative SOS response-associated peptidase YedK
MCGRYVSVKSDEDLTEEFDVEEVVGEAPPPSWNVAPTDSVRIIAKRRPHGSKDPEAASLVQLRTASWGLIPSWSRTCSGAAKMINARAETVTTKPAFKTAAARRRCLCPGLGYYEWAQTGRSKIAHFLHDPDEGRLLAFAGLYELWPDPDLPDEHPRKWVWTCTIITRPASDALGHIHDRSPVIVPAEVRQSWLDCTGDDVGTARQLLDQIPEPHLQPRVVSPAVGNVRNNGPDLIRPVGLVSPRPPREAQQLF